MSVRCTASAQLSSYSDEMPYQAFKFFEHIAASPDSFYSSEVLMIFVAHVKMLSESINDGEYCSTLSTTVVRYSTRVVKWFYFSGVAYYCRWRRIQLGYTSGLPQ